MGASRVEKFRIGEDVEIELYQVPAPPDENDDAPGVVMRVLGQALSFKTRTNEQALALYSILQFVTDVNEL